MHTLYNVEEKEGQFKYGSQYQPISWFSRLHLEVKITSPFFPFRTLDTFLNPETANERKARS